MLSSYAKGAKGQIDDAGKIIADAGARQSETLTKVCRPGDGLGGSAQNLISLDHAALAAKRNGIDMRMIELRTGSGVDFGCVTTVGMKNPKLLRAPNGKIVVTLEELGLRSEQDAVNTIAHEMHHIRRFFKKGNMDNEDTAAIVGELAELFFKR